MTDYNQIKTVVSRIDAIEKRLKDLETAGRLVSAGIDDPSGLTIHSGGTLSIVDGGDFAVQDGGSVTIEDGTFRISDGGLVNISDGGELVANGPYAGPFEFDNPIFAGDQIDITTQQYIGTGLLVQRIAPTEAARADAFTALSSVTGQHEVTIADNLGSGIPATPDIFILGTTVNVPRGLSAPWFLTPTSNTDGGYYGEVSANSWTVAMDGENRLSSDRLQVVVNMFASDASTSGQCRITVLQGGSLVQLGGVFSFAGTSLVQCDFGITQVPFSIGSRYWLRVEMQRTGGSGFLRARIDRANMMS